LRVEGSGFRVQGSGFRVQGSGFRVQGLGLRQVPPRSFSAMGASVRHPSAMLDLCWGFEVRVQSPSLLRKRLESPKISGLKLLFWGTWGVNILGEIEAR